LIRRIKLKFNNNIIISISICAKIIIIFIIIEDINIKNNIICVININISSIVQSIIICGKNIIIFINLEGINIKNSIIYGINIIII
jgi:hypothetical protein